LDCFNRVKAPINTVDGLHILFGMYSIETNTAYNSDHSKEKCIYLPRWIWKIKNDYSTHLL